MTRTGLPLDDPEQARIERRREASRVFDDAMDEAGAGNPAVALMLDRDRRTLQAWRDPSDDKVPSLEAVIGLPSLVRMRITAYLAELDGRALVELPEAADVVCDLRAAAALQRESADVIARHLEAVADGHITRREGAELERECDELLAVVLAIRERARQARREGVVGASLRLAASED